MTHPLLQTICLRTEVRRLHAGYFDKYLTKDMEVFDIGCGDKPFAPILAGKVKKHIGVDIEDGFYDSSHIDLVGTAYEVPAPDAAADAVISSQVIEHLEYPDKALKEAARLLKPGGYLFLSFPFLYPMHAEPIDFNRQTEYGIKTMLRDAGFESVEFTKIGSLWYLIGMSLGIYLQPIDRGILKKTKIAFTFLKIVSWVFMQLHNLEGALIRALGKNPDNYRKKWAVNHVLVAKKI